MAQAEFRINDSVDQLAADFRRELSALRRTLVAASGPVRGEPMPVELCADRPPRAFPVGGVTVGLAVAGLALAEHTSLSLLVIIGALLAVWIAVCEIATDR